MGKCGEREVEVISQLTIPEFRWLRNGIPDPLHVGSECSDKVLHWCGAEVIANDKEQEGLLMSPGCIVNTRARRGDEDQDSPVCSRLAKQPQVDLKHRLEQAHIRSLIQADLMFPQIDKEYLR